MIKISVISSDLRQFSGTSKTSGKPFNMNFQTVWFHLFDKNGNLNPFPEKADIILETPKDGLPLFYEKGEYFLSDTSFYIDRNGSLAVTPRLLPIAKKPL